MNRRSFLKACGLATAAVVCLGPKTLAAGATVYTGYRVVYFKNIPLVFDQYCQTNRIYFINSSHWRTWPVLLS